MKKIIVILVLILVGIRAGAQETLSLNQRSIDRYVNIIKEFTNDNKNYHLQLSFMTGEGSIFNENAIIIDQREGGVIADIFYHRKRSFVWYHIFIEKRDIDNEYDDDGVFFGTGSRKDYQKVTFYKSFTSFPWPDIESILEGLFKSIGFKL